jgi:hypothetical protein
MDKEQIIKEGAEKYAISVLGKIHEPEFSEIINNFIEGANFIYKTLKKGYITISFDDKGVSLQCNVDEMEKLKFAIAFVMEKDEVIAKVILDAVFDFLEKTECSDERSILHCEQCDDVTCEIRKTVSNNDFFKVNQLNKPKNFDIN